MIQLSILQLMQWKVARTLFAVKICDAKHVGRAAERSAIYSRETGYIGSTGSATAGRRVTGWWRSYRCGRRRRDGGCLRSGWGSLRPCCHRDSEDDNNSFEIHFFLFKGLKTCKVSGLMCENGSGY